jgi:hypothetical protein
MELLLFWIGGALLVAIVASAKGRSAFGWLLLSLLLSPLVTLIAVIGVESLRTCPRCAETVKAAASVCRHCGSEFSHKPH